MEVVADYPVAASASGNNAYYLGNCECVGHRPSYAACLHKIEQRKEGRLSSSLAECSAAINQERCPAQALRREELGAGKAIYFIDRAALNSQNEDRIALENDRIGRLMAGERVTETPRRKAAAPAPAPVAPASPGYADAINAAMRDLSKQASAQESSQADAQLRKQASAQPSTQASKCAAPAHVAPAAPVMKLAVLPMLPGESMADYARRVLAARS